MGIDRDIFDAAGRPEADIPDGHVDDAVSHAIRGLRHEPDDQPPGQPQPPPSGAQPAAPDPLAGIDDRSNSGLLRALLDERDKRQENARELETLRRERQERARQEGKAPLNERLFTHPEETLEELRREWTQPFEQQIAELRVNQNFGLAHARHGETFARAWDAWYNQVKGGNDAVTYFTVMNAPDPGEAMVQWHARNDVYTQTGGNLDAYKQKVIDEYLASQGGGAAPPLPRAPNGQFQPRPQAPQQPAPPTSISRMGSTARDEDDDANDGSDAAIFAAARPPARNRRR